MMKDVKQVVSDVVEWWVLVTDREDGIAYVVSMVLWAEHYLQEVNKFPFQLNKLFK